jgi:cell division protein FtsL
MLVNRRQDWEQYELQEEPKVKKVSPSPRHNSGLRRKFVQILVLVAAAAMFVTVQSEVIVRAGYDVVDMKAQAAKLEKENELLRLDIARLKAPQRIQQIAVSQLGMVMPQNTYYASTNAKQSAGQTGDDKASSQVAGVFKFNKAEASKGR